MSKFRPMLAGKAGDALRYPFYASPKLDGVRAMAMDGILYSRSLKKIPNEYCQRLFRQLDWVDGELIVGSPTHPNAYNHTVSGVMTRDGEPDVTFWVFDYFAQLSTAFEERYMELNHRINNTVRVERVPHLLITGPHDLLEFETKCLAEGYEGIMLRDPLGPYKFGRSTTNEGWLLKLKRFSDSEARITGFEEKMHNANEQTTNELGLSERSSHRANKHPTGVLGALIVTDLYSGVSFNIGTGFTDLDRQNIWTIRDTLIGKVVKYKFQPAGVLEKPRFPVFLGFRV